MKSNRIESVFYQVRDIRAVLKKRLRKDEKVVAHEQTVRNGQEEGMKPILLE
jgi:hypothetical protein